MKKILTRESEINNISDYLYRRPSFFNKVYIRYVSLLGELSPLIVIISIRVKNIMNL